MEIAIAGEENLNLCLDRFPIPIQNLSLSIPHQTRLQSARAIPDANGITADATAMTWEAASITAIMEEMKEMKEI